MPIDKYWPATYLWQTSIIALSCAAVLVPASPAVATATDEAAAYREHCASCHASDLTGGAGPALSGFAFADRWVGKDAALYELISKAMPLDAPGTLSAADNRSITDYILKFNKLEDAQEDDAKSSTLAQAPAAPQKKLEPAPDPATLALNPPHFMLSSNSPAG